MYSLLSGKLWEGGGGVGCVGGGVGVCKNHEKINISPGCLF